MAAPPGREDADAAASSTEKTGSALLHPALRAANGTSRLMGKPTAAAAAAATATAAKAKSAPATKAMTMRNTGMGHKDAAKFERQVVNSTCRASAADLMMLAMLNLAPRLQRMRVSGTSCDRPAARIVLQIHDELLLEVEEGALERVLPVVVAEMTDIPQLRGILRVPFRVKCRVGKDWGNLTEVAL